MRGESRATSVRAHMGVHNSHGLPLILGVQVLTLKPWKLTAYLMIYGQHIRRLDVNGTGPVIARSGSSAPTSTGSPRRTRTRLRTPRMTFRLFPRLMSWGNITVERSRRSVKNRPLH